MALRQRREKTDIEEGGSSEERADVWNRNAELEILVASLKSALDYSRRREKKLVQALHECGMDSHIDLETLDDAIGHSSESSFLRSLVDRASWLIGLLVFQSLSSYILEANEQILQAHPNIVYFLTMLVGAGGNAGNQATVRAIRGLAVGSLSKANMLQFMRKELLMSISMCFVLGLFGFLRVRILSSVPAPETVAITLSLMIIVLTSIVVGGLLPIFFHFIGVDPANSSTTIQVVMDISGVLITCLVASVLLNQTPELS